MFQVRGIHRDPNAGNQVVFDLALTPEQDWAVGETTPVHWERHDRDPVKKVGLPSVEALLRRHSDYRPAAAHRWVLEAALDKMSATVVAQDGAWV